MRTVTECALNSLYWIQIVCHSGFLSNLRLPWKQGLPWNFSSRGRPPRTLMIICSAEYVFHRFNLHCLDFSEFCELPQQAWSPIVEDVLYKKPLNGFWRRIQEIIGLLVTKKITRKNVFVAYKYKHHSELLKILNYLWLKYVVNFLMIIKTQNKSRNI